MGLRKAHFKPIFHCTHLIAEHLGGHSGKKGIYMIIRLNSAILHVLDMDSAVTVYSKATLDLEERPVKAYVQSMCRKALNTVDARHGTFASNSNLSVRLSRYFGGGNEDFIGLSTDVARFLFEELERADKQKSTDILCADFLDGDDTHYFGLFLLEGKKAFTHEVSQAGANVSCDIVRHYGVLPAANQKLSSWLLVRSDTMGISYVEKTRTIDGQEVLLIPDELLQCKSEASSRETLDCVNEIVEKIATDHGNNATRALAQAKAYVTENVKTSSTFSRAGLAEEVFSEDERAQQAFETQAEVRHIPKVVTIDKRAVDQKRVRNQRIVTDTGIEVSFPAEYGEDSDMIEFKTESNGLISISLKGIASIENK